MFLRRKNIAKKSGPCQKYIPNIIIMYKLEFDKYIFNNIHAIQRVILVSECHNFTWDKHLHVEIGKKERRIIEFAN